MSFWVAGAAVVAGVGGAVIGKKASDRAARASGDATAQSIAEQQRQFDLVRSDTAGQRYIGDQALNTLGRLYGYGPTPTGGYGAGGPSGTPFSTSLPAASVPGGSLNIGGQLTQKLGGLGKILDPAASIFGSKHGDERRNLQAFMADNQLTDLGNGMVALPDGRTFTKDQVQQVAGAYYGARYHPDGNQADWQQKYDAMLTAAPQQQPAAGPGAGGPSGPDMSVFFKSPDYNFNLQEGQQAIDRSAAARGGLLSGGAIKAGERYASGLASREYSSFVDRLMQQAGLGTTGIGASAAAGANASNNISNAYINNGANRANAYMTGANAINNGLQGTASNLLLMKYLGTAPRA
jgi:hypothetical protein